jgi:hypothetical protein
MADEVVAEIRALQARVESLAANVKSLEADNARLRDRRASSVLDSAGDVPVDRRQLLKLAGKTAVVGTGLAAGAALHGAQPAAADHLAGFGHYNNVGTSGTWVSARVSDTAAFRLYNNGAGDAIVGSCLGGGGAGVVGVSRTQEGVYGSSVDGPGVYGASQSSNAVVGHIGSSGTDNGFNGVYGTNASTGNGVFGEVTNALNNSANAVLGIHRGSGNCVFGYKPAGASGDAVVGYSQTATSRGVLGISTNGRGGAFTGKAAQVQLLPSSATTHPSSGARGDLFVDNSGRLWFCKGSTTWKQLA